MTYVLSFQLTGNTELFPGKAVMINLTLWKPNKFQLLDKAYWTNSDRVATTQKQSDDSAGPGPEYL